MHTALVWGKRLTPNILTDVILGESANVNGIIVRVPFFHYMSPAACTHQSIPLKLLFFYSSVCNELSVNEGIYFTIMQKKKYFDDWTRAFNNCTRNNFQFIQNCNISIWKSPKFLSFQSEKIQTWNYSLGKITNWNSYVILAPRLATPLEDDRKNPLTEWRKFLSIYTTGYQTTNFCSTKYKNI